MKHNHLQSLCFPKGQKTLKNPSSPMAVINGSVNFKKSALNEHALLECHDKGIAEVKHKRGVAAGQSLPLKYVVHKVPADSAIASGMQKMGDKEKVGVKKLMDIASFIALKRRPFTDFKDYIEFENLHEVKFDTNSHENKTACQEFIKTITCYLLDEDVQKKLTRVNSIAILMMVQLIGL